VSGRTPQWEAIGVSASPAPGSRSRRLVARTLAHLAGAGFGTELLDLSDLPADALLARRRDPAAEAAVARVAAAPAVVLGTPVYRATYTGQLKAFFDLFPPDALRGCAVGLIATGASPAHALAVDHGLRPLVASLGGLTAAVALYVTDGQFPDTEHLPQPLDEQTAALAAELRALVAALAPRSQEHPELPEGPAGAATRAP
jgi:FMN reductase